MSNKFEYDPAWGRDRYTYRDSDGDEMQIEAAEAPKDGEDILIHIRDLDGVTTSVWANARELIAAAQKAGNLDLTIVNNVVYSEYFGGKPGSETPVERQALEVQDAINETIAGLAKPKGENPLSLLVELYAAEREAGASDERLAMTMSRIERQVEVGR